MSSLFPEEASWDDSDSAESSNSEVTFGRSWRFDYAAGDFIMTPTRKVAAADEKTAWVEWCKKALLTPRYRYVVYSRTHGQDFEDLIGQGYSRAVQESEIQRIVTETLTVDPRTESVSNFSFSWTDDICSFTCDITNVREETETIEGSTGA
ncbi:DUF2634 domain-containing protein [Paenibacillus sp. HN-1]|uniref:DUF2634 domain-containing protein n=1 Tax=Paenibacillus TaxID=44249 RepID=UPI001CA8388D|nr:MULTISPECIES: DUF2634 domain-containing protein [Paenibacillus]MBY9080989.1 DUF2634 domain-containing protein [Paenibacillus sp. CGMCC 1.18879]MBY9084091.1 DUF2634 domain-containing protein [Paenibacillus sinensis]